MQVPLPHPDKYEYREGPGSRLGRLITIWSMIILVVFTYLVWGVPHF